MVEMELVGVRVELPSNTPIVVLRETTGDKRSLQIVIGGAEATAIAFAVDKVATPRPMSHDLMKLLLDNLGAVLERVVVTELTDRTFFADLHIVVGDTTRKISSRPSDAIALAVRTESPIYVEEVVLDEAGYVEAPPEDSDADPEEVVQLFREFIDNVNPDDFAS